MKTTELVLSPDGRFWIYPDGRQRPVLAGGRSAEPPADPPVQDPAIGDPVVAPPVVPPAPPVARRPRAVPPAVVEPPNYDLTPPPAAGEGIRPAQLVPVKVRGRDVLVSPEAVVEIEEREREYSRGITMDRRQQDELARLQRWEQQVRGGPGDGRPVTPAKPDITDIWFTDPSQAFKRVKEETAQELTGQFRAEMAERDFWDTFYRQHGHYREDDRIVRMLAGDNLPELLALPTPQKRIDRLGELVGTEILRIARKVKTEPRPTGDEPPAPRVERASGDRLPPETTPEEDEEANLPASLGEVIRRRRADRQKAGARK